MSNPIVWAFATMLIVSLALRGLKYSWTCKLHAMHRITDLDREFSSGGCVEALERFNNVIPLFRTYVLKEEDWKRAGLPALTPSELLENGISSLARGIHQLQETHLNLSVDPHVPKRTRTQSANRIRDLERSLMALKRWRTALPRIPEPDGYLKQVLDPQA